MGTLASLGGPRRRRGDHLQSAREQVVDCPWGGRAGEAELRLEALESAGILGRAQVEIAAEEQRRVPRPLGRGRCGAKHVSGREFGPVVGGVQVGYA